MIEDKSYCIPPLFDPADGCPDCQRLRREITGNPHCNKHNIIPLIIVDDDSKEMTTWPNMPPFPFPLEPISPTDPAIFPISEWIVLR